MQRLPGLSPRTSRLTLEVHVHHDSEVVTFTLTGSESHEGEDGETHYEDECFWHSADFPLEDANVALALGAELLMRAGDMVAGPFTVPVARAIPQAYNDWTTRRIR